MQNSKSDCRVWKTFLDDPSSLCRPFIDFSKFLVADSLDFYTDASGSSKLGFGCVFDKEWTHGRWNTKFIENAKPSTEYLELFAVAVAIPLWAENLQNRRVVIYCDNQLVVEMINKSVSSCKNCMVLIQHITFASIKANVCFFARYVKSVDNMRADTPQSRSDAMILVTHKRGDPEVLWPIEKLWIKK